MNVAKNALGFVFVIFKDFGIFFESAHQSMADYALASLAAHGLQFKQPLILPSWAVCEFACPASPPPARPF